MTPMMLYVVSIYSWWSAIVVQVETSYLYIFTLSSSMRTREYMLVWVFLKTCCGEVKSIVKSQRSCIARTICVHNRWCLKHIYEAC